MLLRWVIITGAAVLLLALLASPRVPQDPAYHQFADQRPCGAIPNCLNVLSNIPFAAVGLAGLAIVFRRRVGFADRWERWPYVAMFGGTALTAVGSSYYHLAPDNARLVLDRLPMTVGFMGLLAATLAERASLEWARRLFAPLVLAGALSVVHWSWTETRGAGDLRFYALVQFGSLAAVLVLLLVKPARYTRTAYVLAGLGAYLLAKVFELGDRAIFELSDRTIWAGNRTVVEIPGAISGHSLKHLAAAAGVAWVVAALRNGTRVVLEESR